MNASDTALLLLDLQNDFIHQNGAYAKGGVNAVSYTHLTLPTSDLV